MNVTHDYTWSKNAITAISTFNTQPDTLLARLDVAVLGLAGIV